VSESGSSKRTKYVVYTLDEDAKPGHFLEVCEGVGEVREAQNKWWKAFHNGEKETPKNYNGISMRPVADFDRWNEGDNGN